MWKLNGEDIAVMLATGAGVLVAMEMVVWAITGGYIGF